MGRERWFRGDREGRERPFDWYTLARERDIPIEQARMLYEEALRRAGRLQGLQGNAEALYLELLEEARQEAWRPSPGKVTRTMRMAAAQAGKRRRKGPIAPGKRTLSSYLEPPAHERRNATRADQERERLEVIAVSFRGLGVAVPADLQSALARGQHAELPEQTSAAGFIAADAVSDVVPPIQERSEPGVAADRRLEANLLAALGHLDEADAVLDRELDPREDEARREAGPSMALEASRPGEADRGDSAQPLPEATRARMEQVFGQSFARVVVHPESPAVPAGQQAFTRGNDIHFGKGAFAPDTAQGDHVLAHELAHVVQQSPASAARPHRAPSIAALEADAHQAAMDVLAGRAATVHVRAPAGLALGFTDAPPQQDALPAPEPHAARGSAPGMPGPLAQPGAPGAARGPVPANAGGAVRSPASPAPARPPQPGPVPAATATPAVPAPAPAADAAAGAGDLHLPEAPAALSADARARLADIDAGIQGVAAATTDLPSAEHSTEQARGAVTEPQTEQDARAQAGVVAAVDDRPPPSPEIEAACARIREVIRDKRPPDEESLVEAEPRAMAAEAGRAMNAGIDERAGTVRDGYADMAHAPPGQPGQQPVPVQLPPEQADIPDIDAAAGAPDELTADEVSLDADLAAQRQRIDDAGMATEPAQLVQDGPVAEARAGVGDLEAMSQRDPDQVLADQAAAIAQAAGDMRALQEAAEQALAQARAGTVQTLGVTSGEITGSEEQQRAQAGARMQAIFQGARRDVDSLLAPLGETALARWDAGVDRFAADFESSLSSVQRRIEERYQTEDDWDPFDEIGAAFTRWGDEVFGLPDWVVDEYDRAEQTFADGCADLIRDISRDVNAVIESCQGIIRQARQDIDAIAASLPEELQAWAQGEAARLGTELDALESQVSDTRQRLNQDLIDRSNQAVQEVRERVHALREQAKGLVGRIGDAIAAFLADPGRAIVDGLLRVLGIPPASFWALVDQLGTVVDGIAADPMGFANTLMAGVGQGFEQFFDSFPLHLGQSLFAWLFSRLGEAGVAMPLDFSVPSIVSLVLDVLGINWARIRTLLAKHIGEDNVAHVERAYDIVTTFIAQGPLGLVELMREQLDPQSIVDMIRETAIRYLMETIVTRVATRILLMLNPAGAILQAVEAIYRVLSWIYDNAARIFTLIEAVVNGAAQILAGNTAGLAALVEGALVGLMVPVIDFLADYLGLGGIPEAIRDLIMGLQQRIEQILDRVIAFVAEQARALLGALGVGGQQEEQPGGDGGLGEEIRFQAEDEGHRLWVEPQPGGATLMVASTPMTVEQRLAHWRGRVAELSDQPDPEGIIPRNRAESLLGRAESLHEGADAEADRLARQRTRTTGAGASQGQAPDDSQLVQRERHLADVLRQLFDVFGDSPAGQGLVERFAADIAMAHRDAQAALRQGVQQLETQTAGADGTSYQGWEQVRAALLAADPDNPIQPILDKPLLQAHQFGATAHEAQAVPQAQAAIAEYQRSGGAVSQRIQDNVSRWVVDQKRSIHAAPPAAPFLGSKQALQEEIFVASRATAANTMLRREFSAKLRDEGVGLDPDLERSVNSRGIVAFMYLLARQGAVDGITHQRFESLWGATENRNWLKEQLLKAVPAGHTHEWIPRNYIPEVIARASSAENAIQAAKWIRAQNRMRSDTRGLIYLPSVYCGVALGSDGAQKVALSAHAGALYIRDPRNRTNVIPSTTGQGPWHDRLRTAFDRGATIAQVIENIERVFVSTIWEGSVGTVGVPLGDLLLEYFASTNPNDHLLWRDLRTRQATHYRAMLQEFRTWKTELT